MTFVRVARPIVHYLFGCDHKGEPQVVESGPLLDTLVAHHQNPPLCHISTNGIISSSILESSASIEELQQASQHAEAFVMELWITLLDNSELPSPILAFADSTYSSLIDEDCAGVQIALTQRGDQLEVRFVEYNDFQHFCRVLVIRNQDLALRQMHHVVVVWLKGQTTIYLDGVPIIEGAPSHFDTTLSIWDHRSTLQLLGQGFGASLNMVSIYNHPLTDTEVADLYRQGKLLLTTTRRDPLQIDLLQAPPVHTSAQGTTTPLRVVTDFDFVSSNLTAPNDWSILIEFQSLPIFGSLFHNEQKEYDSRIHLNQRIPLEYVESIWYNPDSPNFFNAPSFSFNGTSLDSQREFFSYRLIAVSSQETQPRILALSETVEQELIVIHVNHPPVLRTPKNATISKDQSTGMGARPHAYVEGIQLLDELDFNIDRVRVDIWTYNGTLELAHLELADFSSCRASERHTLLGNASWSCFGDGTADRNLTFVATPDDVTLILSKIEYHGFNWGQEDQIVIRIHDGVDGSCLSQKEHRVVPYQDGHYHTIHNDECFEVFAAISIPVIPRMEVKGSYVKDFLDVGEFGVADALFWGFLLLLSIACCVSIRTCIRCFGARGSKIHVEDASNDGHSLV